MIYLASPYSHKSPAVVERRVELTGRVATDLVLRGLFVYSPIIHWHGLCLQYELPSDAEYWSAFNTNMIRRAEAMYVITIDGWKESIGVRGEISLAKQLGIPLTSVNERGLIQLEAMF